MNCAKYTLKRLSPELKHSKSGKLLETTFAMSYFRQDPSPTSMSRTGNCWDNAAMESFFSWGMELYHQASATMITLFPEDPLARFVRKTLSFSQDLAMHEACLNLFLPRYNRCRGSPCFPEPLLLLSLAGEVE